MDTDRYQAKLIKARAITVKDFSKICRFCMSQSETLKAIFKDETYDTGQNITKMFIDCLNLDVSIGNLSYQYHIS